MRSKYYWPNRSFVSFDTETTGLSVIDDRIIQSGLSVFLKGQNIWNFQWFSNTARPSHEDAVATHGITDEWRWANGIHPRNICEHLLTMLNRLRESNQPLIVFNAAFDLALLRAEFRRFNMNFNTEGLYVIDPLVIDRHFETKIPVFTKPYMRLGQMAARYGVSAPTHDALDDAKCTGYIAVAQSIHHPSIRSISIRDLHMRQTQWYEEFAAKVDMIGKKKNVSFLVPPWPWGWDSEPTLTNSRSGAIRQEAS